jgi:hypothetical protein
VLAGLVLFDSPDHIYNVHRRFPERREGLIRAVWGSGLPGVEARGLARANPGLAAVFNRIHDLRSAPADEAWRAANDNQAAWVESLMACLVRGQSKFATTLLTVRVSLAALRCQLPVDIWTIIHMCAPGLLMGREWTIHLAGDAERLRPPPSYEVLPGVGAIMFDNYTRRVLYKAQWTMESSGYRLDMTNSCTMAVPKLVQFDANAECALPPHPHCTSTPTPYPLPDPLPDPLTLTRREARGLGAGHLDGSFHGPIHVEQPGHGAAEGPTIP